MAASKNKIKISKYTDNSVICKSGWLYIRNNDGNWQKNYCELYRDGYFKIYENDHAPNPREIVFMPTECVSIKFGYQVDARFKLPSTLNQQYLFSVTTINNKTYILCAESINDLKIWHGQLEEARLSMIKSNYPLFNQALARNSNPLITNPLMQPQFSNTSMLLPQFNYFHPQTLTHATALPYNNTLLNQPVFQPSFVPNLPINNYPSFLSHTQNTTPFLISNAMPLISSSATLPLQSPNYHLSHNLNQSLNTINHNSNILNQTNHQNYLPNTSTQTQYNSRTILPNTWY